MQIQLTRPQSTSTMPPQNHGLPNPSLQGLLILHHSMLSLTTTPTCSVRVNRDFAPTFYSQDICTDALSNGELFSLDMSSLKAATGSSLSWADVGKPSFTTTNYQPVMALAQNHIHFLDVPGVPAGSAQIFVIHCGQISFQSPSNAGAHNTLQFRSSSQMRSRIR